MGTRLLPRQLLQQLRRPLRLLFQSGLHSRMHRLTATMVVSNPQVVVGALQMLTPLCPQLRLALSSSSGLVVKLSLGSIAARKPRLGTMSSALRLAIMRSINLGMGALISLNLREVSGGQHPQHHLIQAFGTLTGPVTCGSSK